MQLRFLFHRLFGWRVLAGPFAGMAYVGDFTGSILPPKLLGCYERELHDSVRRLLALHPAVIVNVGAGEGYYAVGLARLLPRTKVWAFEAEALGRTLIAQVARQNDVADRLTIGGLCTLSDLSAALDNHDSPWLIIDVEGAEDHLLDPVKAPALLRTTILVEVHDFVDSSLGDRLRERFARSHACEELWTQARTTRDLPWWLRAVVLTPWRDRVLRAMDEQRPGPMRWFVLTPRVP